MRFIKVAEWYINLDRVSCIKETKDVLTVAFLDHDNHHRAVTIKRASEDGVALLEAIQERL